MRLAAGAMLVGLIATGAAIHAQSAAAKNPCLLLTKADVQKATGRSDAMRSPNMPDDLNGKPVCTIDGGDDLDIELIIYPRAVTTPLTPPKGGESVAVGASAYFQSAPGNFEVFTVKTLTSKYALHVGLQSKRSAQAIKPIAISLAQSAIAKLE